MHTVKTLVFIRHAQSTLNVHSDDTKFTRYDPCAKLTPLGIDQASRLSSFMNKLQNHVVISSPLTRALNTVTTATAELGMEIRLDNRLSELSLTRDFDTAITQREWDVILQNRILYPWLEVAPGLESLYDQHLRVASFIQEIRDDQALSGMTVVCVSHAFTIELALLYLMGLQFDALQRFRFKISHTGIFVWEICSEHADSSRGRLVTSNNLCHMTSPN